MRLWVAVAILVLVAGCGTLQGPRTGTISPPTDALAQWSDFSADQMPRPIVLLDRLPVQNFSSRDAKIAALCGKFKLAFQLSSDVPKHGVVAGWAGGISAAYPAISALDAYSAMVKNPIHASDPACATTPPLVLSASLFAVAGFETDRGQAQMSAWLFTSPGLMGDVDYPALAPSAYWHGGPTASSIGGLANVSPDGRVLVFTFPGGPPDGPCAVDYTGVIAESPHAVAIAVQSSPGRTLAGPDSCHLIDHTRLVTVRLASPLGARVVVDASGAAVQVCPGTIPIGC